MVKASGSNVIKLFMYEIYELSLLARVFVLGKPLQRCLTNLPKSGAHEKVLHLGKLRPSDQDANYCKRQIL
jgi:hypothetical protein